MLPLAHSGVGFQELQQVLWVSFSLSFASQAAEILLRALLVFGCISVVYMSDSSSLVHQSDLPFLCLI